MDGRRQVSRHFLRFLVEYITHLCPILILTGCVTGLISFVSYSRVTGHNFCVLFSQGTTFVSYSHRAPLLCPILTGMNKCVLFSQG